MMEEKDLVRYVGLKIKEYRKKRGLTQRELADKVGLKHNTISTYESGRNAPEQNMIYGIANALGVYVDAFFPKDHGQTDELERALMMVDGLEIKDIEFLNELVKKTLSLKGSDRDKFIDSVKFTVAYHDRMSE